MAQAHLLRRYRPAGIDCLLDGDEAGRKAALRILPICVKSALDIRFLLLPPEVTPTTCSATEGLAGLENLKDESLSGIAFAVSMYLGETKEPTPTQKNTVLEHIFEIVAETDSLVARDEYLAQAIRLMKLEESSARQEFARFLSKKNSPSYGSRQRASSEKNPKNASQKLTTAEDDLLLFVLHHNEVAIPLAQAIQPEWLNLTSPSGTILAKALAEIREDNGNGLASLDELLENDDERNTAYEILSRKPAHDDPVDMHKACNASLQALFNRYFKAKENEIRERVANLNPDGIDQRTELRAELASLRSQRGSLPQLTFVQQPETDNNSAHVTDQRKPRKRHRPKKRRSQKKPQRVARHQRARKSHRRQRKRQSRRPLLRHRRQRPGRKKALPKKQARQKRKAYQGKNKGKATTGSASAKAKAALDAVSGKVPTPKPLDDAITDKVHHLIHHSREQGFLTYKDIDKALPEIASQPDELQNVISILNNLEVKILDGVEVDKYKKKQEESEEEYARTTQGDMLDDPVRMYLKQMGQVPLLYHERRK